MNPKVLLSSNTNKQYYIDAVKLCGGIADAQYCPVASAKYDGLILCGGNDIHPKHYNEAINGSIDIDEQRDAAEILLITAFLKAGKPIMGICRGMQLLNVFFGGNLYQNLNNAHLHTNKTDYYCVHNVQAKNNSICADLYDESFSVNSSHHQAVKVLGRDLIPTVYSDKIIEGFEHKNLPVIGVQWHPERMCASQQRTDTVDGSKIIQYFINKCK